MSARIALLGMAVGVALHGFGSGFALYEPSSVSHAMGGALVGRAMDGSANFNNPATLSDLTNYEFAVGFVTEHPRTRVKVDGKTAEYMDPGFFVLPSFQLVAPLPWDFTFGLGMTPEWGLGTTYGDNWDCAWNSRKTLVQGYTLAPNLAYRVLDDWSVGAGLRFLYFDFEQTSSPHAALGGTTFGTLDNRLTGDNNFGDMGFQVGTSYKVFDNFAVGLVYRSKTDVHVRGRSRTSVKSYAMDYAPVVNAVDAAARQATGRASADLELPQSIAGGFNWDITDTVHFGAMVSWTQWSCMDTLVFNLPHGDKPIRLNWRDTWRFSLAPAWDFAEDWTAMCSYVFDTDATSYTQESTMLPPGDRHIGTVGLVWRCWAGLELSLSYGMVLSNSRAMTTSDERGNSHHLVFHRGISHAAGFTVTYRF